MSYHNSISDNVGASDTQSTCTQQLMVDRTDAAPESSGSGQVFLSQFDSGMGYWSLKNSDARLLQVVQKESITNPLANVPMRSYVTPKVYDDYALYGSVKRAYYREEMNHDCVMKP